MQGALRSLGFQVIVIRFLSKRGLMLIEIGRRLMITKTWRWLPGMLTLGGDRVKHVTDDGRIFLDRGYVTLNDSNDWSVDYALIDNTDLPDASDASTQGSMLEVIHRATGCNPSLYFLPEDKRWVIALNGQQKKIEPMIWENELKEELFLDVFEGI